MPTEILKLPRCFQIWSYTVGHGQLLLRSTKSEGFSTRIDVLFKDVEEFQLMTILDRLEVSEEDNWKMAGLSIQSDHSRLVGRKVFIVKGSKFSGYVVAAVVGWHEDELEYYDPSHFK